MASVHSLPPVSASDHRFWLDRRPGVRPDDGWIEVARPPGWTGLDGDGAKPMRRHLRGRWIRVAVKGHGRAAIFRRLSVSPFSSEAEGLPAGTAVRLSWGDQITLLNETQVIDTEVPVELELSWARWWDWPRIVARRPRRRAEGAIVGVVGVALGLLGIALAVVSFVWSGRSLPAPHPPLPTAIRIGVLGRDKCEMTVRRVGETIGSAGVSIECEADPGQQLTFRADCLPAGGRWTLRVDDRRSTPSWLPLESFNAVRVTGSDRYRFLIYSDDVRSSISINDVSLQLAEESDQELPLAWPREGPLWEAEQAAYRSEWEELLGLSASDGTIAKAKAITNFVYQRSNVTRATPPMSFANPRSWFAAPPRTIDGLCGRFGTAVVELCAALGIVARPVALATQKFFDGTSPGDTHVLAEVFDPAYERWILFDPTFNVVFAGPDDRMMGLRELLASESQGSSWRIVPIGPLRQGRTVDEYYLKYSELLFMGNAPAVSALGDLGAEYRSHAQTVSEVALEKYASSRQ